GAGDPVGEAVLDRVGEQLGGAEVGDGLDRRGGPDRDVGDQVDRDGAAGGERGERVGEAVVEHRRMDATGQVAQLDERVLGRLVGEVDEFPGLGQVEWVGQLLLGHPEVHSQGGKPDLGTCGEVAIYTVE